MITRSPRLEYILENAKKEALHLRTGDVGTEHLLLAIMHDADCVAARMLITLNINLQKILQDVLNAAGVDAKNIRKRFRKTDVPEEAPLTSTVQI